MTPTLSSVQNALRILHLLRQRGPLKLSEVSASLGVGTSTAHRLMSTLRAERFVIQEPGGRQYSLGPAMLYTASASAIEHCALVAAPSMRILRELLNETVHLTILKGNESIFVAATESTKQVRVGSRVGQHPEAHTTAAGKVLLADIPLEKLLELYPNEKLAGLTARSLTTRTSLLSEIGSVGGLGYARNVGESELDMYAIAVPITRPGGEVTCSLSIAAPLSRVGPLQDDGLSGAETEFLRALRESQAQIEARLGF
ncbi:MAG: hypothetical protein JWR01_2356 [Subtercola sp.]|nr:hypothetical protein [Subtercola sp.]